MSKGLSLEELRNNLEGEAQNTAAQVIMGYENNKKEEVCDNVEKK